MLRSLDCRYPQVVAAVPTEISTFGVVTYPFVPYFNVSLRISVQVGRLETRCYSVSKGTSLRRLFVLGKGVMTWGILATCRVHFVCLIQTMIHIPPMSMSIPSGERMLPARASI